MRTAEVRAIVRGAVLVLGLFMAASHAGAFEVEKYREAVEKRVHELNDSVQEGPYRAEWASLEEYNEAPEWFRDAKLGIYFHWGVYSVPAFGSEWYPRHMHLKDRPEYKHHAKTYGEPTEFGYHDFVSRFGADNFDADRWATLFEEAGARFAGPVAEHHDGFSMWDSEVTPWNAADRGPKRDIAGLLADAVRERGMRFIATFHHARNNLWKKNGEWTGHYSGVKKNFPSLLENPELHMLYGYMPREQFLDFWLAKLKEVVDQYQPSLVWFDSWLDEVPESYQKRYLAYFYNSADKWGKDVVVTRKQDDLPLEVSVEDYEKGRADRLTERPWLTDDTISKGSWCYTEGLKIKSLNTVLDTFIDIVSKNGVLLLNISPKADGTIPERQKKVLRGLGDWLDRNGEAIYGTRPWKTFGEGPTRLEKGGHFVGHLEYTASDVRFTRSKDGHTLYAILLDWPGTNERVTMKSVSADNLPNGVQIEDVSILGHEGDIDWKMTGDGLAVTMPGTAIEDRAVALKLEATGPVMVDN